MNPPNLKYLGYAAIAVIFGLIFAFGFVGFSHQPPPVVVQLKPYTPYQPASAPAPAIPTIVPEQVKDPGKFDPAPAPVVVTTQPLPTITPSPMDTYGLCDPSQDDLQGSTCAMSAAMLQVASLVGGVLPIMIILVISQAIFQFMGLLDPRDRY